MSNPTCVFSRHIVTEYKSTPIEGLIIIKEDKILQVIEVNTKISKDQLKILYHNYKQIDYEDYYISPGNISFGARREWESYSSMTQSALSGGTTLVIEESTFYSEADSKGSLYTNVGWVQTIQISKDIPEQNVKKPLAYKAYLSNPSALQGGISSSTELFFKNFQNSKIPLIIDINSPDQRMLYLASPCRNVSLQQRKNKKIVDDSKAFGAGFAEENQESIIGLITCNSDDSEQEDSPQNHKKDDGNLYKEKLIKNLDRKVRKCTSQVKNLSSLELSTYSGSGETQYTPLSSPSPLLSNTISPFLGYERSQSFQMNRTKFEVARNRLGQLRPERLQFIKPTRVKMEMQPYINYLSNSPDIWEINGIATVGPFLKQIQCKVLIPNLSSAMAINKLKDLKASNNNISCSTCDYYLFFDSGFIADGDTRFKDSPPIRDNENKQYLWEFFNLNLIDIVSARHVASSSEHKFAFQGDFKRAVNGINSISSAFQAVWTRIHEQFSLKQQLEEFLVFLSNKMSTQVANFFGLGDRGSIKKGKKADFIVWNPYEKSVVSETFSDMQDTSVYYGLSLYGKILQVYLEGQNVYDGKRFRDLGCFI